MYKEIEADLTVTTHIEMNPMRIDPDLRIGSHSPQRIVVFNALPDAETPDTEIDSE
jgi:hypothetical protein